MTFSVIPGDYTVKAYYVSNSTTYTGTNSEVTVNEGLANSATVTVASGYSVDHIDISILAKATITLNGNPLTETITLTQDDFNGKNDTIWSITTSTGDTYIISGLSTSTDSSNTSQIRFDGVFPIGDKDNPVYYTFTFVKMVTFTDSNGKTYEVEMTFSATFSYWDDDNECPGLGGNWSTNKKYQNGSGMDFTLSAEATANTMTVYKYVEDTKGNYLDASDTTYEFTIYKFNISTNEYEVYKTITLNPTSNGLAMNTFQIEDGTYYIEESSYSSSVTVSNTSYPYQSTNITIAKDGETIYNGDVIKSDTFIVSGNAITVSVTNYYEPVTSIPITKVWVDDGSSTPDSISVDVYQSVTVNGETATNKYGTYTLTSTGTDVNVTVDNNGNWTYTVENLPMYDSSGNEYTYTIKEVSVEDYSSNIIKNDDGSYTITNTELTSIPITKVWVDDGSSTPNSISVILNQSVIINGETTTNEYGTYTLTSTGTDANVTVDNNGNWSYTISDLPKYDANGVEYTYTIDEDSITGYSSVITGNASTGYIIMNTETTEITATKVWDDNSDVNSTRPDSITLELLANSTIVKDTVTLTGIGNTWTYQFTNLDKYDSDGKEISYTVRELDGTNVISDLTTFSGKNGSTYLVTYDDTNNTITNTLQAGNLSISKTLHGGDTSTEFEFTVTLNDDNTNNYTYATTTTDGTSTSNGTIKFTNGVATVYLKGGETLTIIGLPTGTEYTVTESNSSGYILVSGSNTKGTITTGGTSSASFVNSESTDITVTKLWNIAAGYSITSYPDTTLVLTGTATNGYTQTYLITSTDNEVTIDNSTGEWSYTFEDLPLYTSDGYEITYTVSESGVNEYSLITLEGKTYYVTVTENQNSYTVTNNYPTTNVQITGTKTLTLNEKALDLSGYTFDFTITEVADASGTEKTGGYTSQGTYSVDSTNNTIGNILFSINYTTSDIGTHYYKITENSSNYNYVTDASSSYIVEVVVGKDTDGNLTTEVTYLNNSINFENTIDTGSLSITKKLNNEYVTDTSTKFPFAITLTNTSVNVNGTYDYTISDSSGTASTGKITFASGTASVLLLAGQTITIAGLPVGTTYSITENETTGYENVTTDNTSGTISTSESSVTFTNKAITEVKVTKAWNDNSKSHTSDEIIVKLMNGTTEVTTATLNNSNSWSYTFTNLDKYDADGKEIEYTIEEVSINGYNSVITGSASAGYKITNTETTEITATKVWEDNSNINSTRPTSITLELLANGNDVVKTVTLTKDSSGVTVDSTRNQWTYTFSDLDKYDSSGNLITYTVRELNGNTVIGNGNTILGDNGSTYSVTYNDTSNTITNTLQAGDLSISKTLYGNDTTTEFEFTIKLDDTNNNYTYATTTSDTITFTNGVATVNIKAGETLTIIGLPTGTKYTVTETSKSGYTLVSSTGTTGTIETGKTSSASFVNNELTNVTVTKIWDDNDNINSTRPDTITLALYTKTTTLNASSGEEETEYTYMCKYVTLTKNSDGTVSAVETDVSTGTTTSSNATVTSNNKWSYTFTGLEKYDSNGNEIVYVFREISDGTLSTIYAEGNTFAGNNNVLYTVSYNEDSNIVTNTLSTGNLSISKTVYDDSSSDTSFDFSIVLTRDDNGNTTYVSGIYNYIISDSSGTVSTGTITFGSDGKIEAVKGTAATSIQLTNGQTITIYGLPTGTIYTVTEASTNDYVLITDNALTGTIAKDSTSSARFINSKSTDIIVTKLWDIASGYTIDSYPDTTLVLTGTAINGYIQTYLITSTDNEVTIDNSTGEWSYTFEDLPLYTSDGYEITYTVSESGVNEYSLITLEGKTYYVTVTENQNSYTVTNNYPTTNVQITGTKTLTLNEKALDLSGYTFDFTITEVADASGTEKTGGYTSQGTYSVDSTNNTIGNILFSINYTTSDIGTHYYKITENSSNYNYVTDASSSYIVEVVVGKDTDGNLTTEVTYLNNSINFENTIDTGSLSITKKFNNENVTDDTQFSFAITLTNTSVNVNGTYDYTITNSSGIVSKTGKITVANGVISAVDGTTTTSVSLLAGQTITITGLPVGTTYSVSENDMTGYENVDYSGTSGTITTNESSAIFTNKAVTDVAVTKVWNDNNNINDTRLDIITLALYTSDGVYANKYVNITSDSIGNLSAEETDTTTSTSIDTSSNIIVNNDNSWSYTFIGLDKYDSSGNEITYVIKEVSLNNDGTIKTSYASGDTFTGYNGGVYTVSYVNNTVTNTLNTGDLSISKTVYEDSTSNTLFDFSIVLTRVENSSPVYVSDTYNYIITTDGSTETKSGTITFGSNGTIEKVDNNSATTIQLKGEQTITIYGLLNGTTYEVKESSASGYVLVSSRNTTGTIVTNGTLSASFVNSESTNIVGTKVWKDNSDAYGTRPASVTVNLLQNGTQINSTTVTSSDGWKYTFDNLAKYDSAGKLYEYAVTEEAVSGYETVVTGNAIDGYTVTNTLTDTTSVEVNKVWKDNGNAYNTRPTSITVNLLQNGTIIKTVDVTGDSLSSDWSYTFNNLDKYDSDGKMYTYTVTENSVENYTTSIDGTTITNTLTGITSVEVNKVWKDNGNAYNTRPTLITVNLLQNGTIIKTVDVTGASSSSEWSYTFDNLDKYDNDGKKYTYTITEEAVSGYTTSIDGTTITNTLTDITSVEVTKVWKDNSNAYNTRPTSIIVNLLQNGTVIKTAEMTGDSASSDWSYTFKDLDKYDSTGTLYKYTVTEDEVSGYTTSIDGTTITNTLTGTTSVEVTKVWKDNGNAYNTRPTSITVNLLQNGTTIKTVDVTGNSLSSSWSYTFNNLAKYDSDGKKYTYTITEEAVSGYITTYNGYNITNTITGTVDISGEKTWIDGNKNHDNEKEITLTLTRVSAKAGSTSETVTATVEWSGNTYTYSNLPKYDSEGYEYTYTVTEAVISGYKTTYDGFNITNTQLTDITVTKVWKDNSDAYDTRPNSVTVVLYANDSQVVDTVALSGTDDTWTYTFSNLDKYDSKGDEIKYTVREVIVNADDSKTVVSSISGENSSTYTVKNEDTDTGTTITNTLTGTTKVTVTKTWNIKDNIVNEPTSNIAITLTGSDGSTYNGTLSSTNWTWTKEDLPLYTSEGKLITYSVVETNANGHLVDIDGLTYYVEYNSTTDADGNTILNITNNYPYISTQIVGSKTLTLNNTNLDLEANQFEFLITEVDSEGNILYDSDNDVLYSESTTNSADGSIVFDLYYTFDDVGTHYYKITEVKGNDDNISYDINSSYMVKVVVTESNGTLNVSEPEYLDGSITFENTVIRGSLTINKTVESNDSSMSLDRTYQFTVTTGSADTNDLVYYDKDGNSSDSEVYVELTTNSSGNGDVTIGNLPVGTYTVTEVNGAIDGYILDVTDNGIISVTLDEDHTDISANFTNTYSQLTDITVTKVWKDNGNAYKTRPTSININLLQNDSIIKTVEVKADTNGDWSYTFEDLDKYDNTGTLYKYTVTEETVSGYETAITGDATDGFTVTNTLTGTTKVTVTKEWNINVTGVTEPTTDIDVTLTGSDGSTYSGILSSSNWTWAKENLPLYTDEGVLITYSVVETAANGSLVDIDGLTYYVEYDSSTDSNGNTILNITNNYPYISTTVVGSKTLTLNNTNVDLEANQFEFLITEVDSKGNTIYDVNNDVLYSDTTTNSANGSFAYDIYYTSGDVGTHYYKITEVKGNDETIAYDTNSSYMVKVEVSESNGTLNVSEPEYLDGSITFTNTVIRGSLTINKTVESNDPSMSLERTYQFTITTGSTDTNDLVYYDSDGNVSQDKVYVELKTNSSGNGDVTIDNLPVGTYTVTEVNGAIDGYDLDVTDNGIISVTLDEDHTDLTADFTNTYSQLTDFTVTKVWKDNSDAYDTRPDSVIVVLYANGTEVKDTATLSGTDDTWTYTFSDLDKYDSKGNEIKYTVREVIVNADDSKTVVSSISGENSSTYTVKNEDTDTGTTITNTLTGTTDVTVTKTWNIYNHIVTEPTSNIAITLTGSDGSTYSGTLSSANWTWTKEDLPLYTSGGELITYSVVETNANGHLVDIDGLTYYVEYNSTTDADGNTILNITNNYPHISTTVVGTKTLTLNGKEVTLEDDQFEFLITEVDSQGNILYDSDNDVLYSDTTTNSTDGSIVFNLYYTFDDVGTHYYKITEVKGNDDNISYDTNSSYMVKVEVTESNGTLNVSEPKYLDGSIEFENTVIRGSLTINKTVESNDSDMSLERTYQFTVTTGSVDTNNLVYYDKDGNSSDSEVYVELKTNSSGNGDVTINNLPVGTYTVTEVNGAIEGYDLDVTDNGIISVTLDEDHTDLTADFTNTYSQLTDITVTKVWKDNGNAYNTRSESITVNLLQNGTTIKTVNVTGDSANSEWSYTFENLDKYDSSGKLYTYTVTENEVSGYKTAIIGDAVDGFTVTNTLTGTTKVTVTKERNINATGVTEPTTDIDVTLKGSDGSTYSGTLSSTNWTWTKEGLPLYTTEGELITYSVVETNAKGHLVDIDGLTYYVEYDSTTDSNGNTILNITNNYPYISTTVVGSKTLTLNGKEVALDDDQFEFLITEVDSQGNTLYDTDNNVLYSDTTTNSKDGSIVFDLYYTPDDVGIHYYKITEVKGSDDTIAYDTSSYMVMVEVTESNGTLNVSEPEYLDGSIEFENTVIRGSLTINKTVESNDSNMSLERTYQFTITTGSTDTNDLVYYDSDGKASQDKAYVELKTNSSGNGNITINNLPVGTYTVTEVNGAIEGYDLDVTDNGIISVTLDKDHTDLTANFTNTYSQLTDITVTKVWKDNSDAYDTRPNSITVVLYVNGTEVKDTVTLSGTDDTWTYTFTGLDKYDSKGDEIKYTVREVIVNADDSKSVVSSISGKNSSTYTVISKDTDTGTTITNTLTGTTSVTVTKTWKIYVDNVTVPTTDIDVTLIGSDGSTYSGTLSSTNWTWTKENLPLYTDEGELITYSVVETNANGHLVDIDGLTYYVVYSSTTDADGNTVLNITNSYPYKSVEIVGTKTLTLNNTNVDLKADQFEFLITEVDSNGNTLYDSNNNVLYSDTTTNSADGSIVFDLYYTFDDVGVHYYKIIEVKGNDETIAYDTNSSYMVKVEVTESNGTLNVSEPEYLDNDITFENTVIRGSLTINKTVESNDSSMSLERTYKFTVTTGSTDTKDLVYYDKDGNATDSEVYVELKTNSSGNGDVTINNLPVGIYTVTEVNGAIDGYTLDVTDKGIITVTLDEDNTDVSANFTNTYSQLTDITVTKVWKDNGNAYNTRPESITVNLLQNGTTIKTVNVTGDSANSEWLYTFENLDKYDSSGKLYTYTVTENTVSGYETSIDGTTITNTLTGTTNVTVTKTWNIKDDTVTVPTTDIDVTLKGSDGSTYSGTLNSTNWTWTKENLPLYTDEGVLITYSVVEANAKGHLVDIDNLTYYVKYDSTTDTDGNTILNITNNYPYISTEVVGSKTLTLNGKEVALDDDQFEFLITEVDSKGNTLYDTDNDVLYSETTTNGADSSIVFDLYYTPDDVGIHYYKITEVKGSDDTIAYDTSSYMVMVEVTESNGTLSVSEPEYLDGSIAFENTVIRGSLTINKTVESNDSSMSLERTYKFTVTTGSLDTNDLVYYDKDGNATDSEVYVELITNSSGKGFITVDNLPVGTYTVTEVNGDIDGYELDVTDDGIISVTLDEDHTDLTADFTNTYSQLTDITVTKVWKDNSDAYDTRPDSITVVLYANGTEVKDTVTLTGTDDTWTYTFSNLDKYDSNGDEIKYTVREVIENVDGSKSVVSSITGENGSTYIVTNKDSDTGTIITNTLTSTTELTVTKVWHIDGDEVLPVPITIALYANEEKVKEMTISSITDGVTVNSDGSWSYTFTDLDEYDANGTLIDYSIKEVGESDGIMKVIYDDGSVAVFGVSYDEETNTITNSYPVRMDIAIVKEWHIVANDVNIDDVVIDATLYADGKEVGTTQLIKDNDWKDTTTFANMLKYNNNGEEIEYSVIETIDGVSVNDDHEIDIKVNIDGESETLTFSTDYDGLAYDEDLDMYVLTIKNSYPPTTNITIHKVWANDNEETRPDSISVTIYGTVNGEDYGQPIHLTLTSDDYTVNTDDSWTYIYEGLDKYDSNGNRISYEVIEDTVDGYIASYKQDDEYTTTITNYYIETEKDVLDSNGNSINDGMIQVGDTLTYTIEYTNITTNEQSIVISDAVPEGTTYVENSAKATIDGIESTDISIVETDGKITWTLDALEAGSTIKVSFDVVVDNTAVESNTITNTATVSINHEYEFDTNTVTNDVPKEPVKDVLDSDGNSMNGETVQAGDTLTYVISYTNVTSDEQFIVVSDDVPKGTTYVENSAKVTIDGIESTAVVISEINGKLTWTLDALDAGSTIEVSFDVTVNESISGSMIENTAYVQIDNSTIIQTNTVTTEVHETPTTDIPEEPTTPSETPEETPNTPTTTTSQTTYVQTGDDSHYEFWMSMMGLAFIGISYIYYSKKRYHV
ncbi:MAG: Cna B-type domain-containing protein [Erysipelotrichaceae bacterium]|nr:Cna B-type domain-containing protein [Erysipelotrichaceae bacterium]